MSVAVTRSDYSKCYEKRINGLLFKCIVCKFEIDLHRSSDASSCRPDFWPLSCTLICLEKYICLTFTSFCVLRISNTYIKLTYFVQLSCKSGNCSLNFRNACVCVRVRVCVCVWGGCACVCVCVCVCVRA